MCSPVAPSHHAILASRLGRCVNRLVFEPLCLRWLRRHLQNRDWVVCFRIVLPMFHQCFLELFHLLFHLFSGGFVIAGNLLLVLDHTSFTAQWVQLTFVIQMCWVKSPISAFFKTIDPARQNPNYLPIAGSLAPLSRPTHVCHPFRSSIISVLFLRVTYIWHLDPLAG